MGEIKYIDDGLSEESFKKRMKLVDDWNFLICGYAEASGDDIINLNSISEYLSKALKFYFDNLPFFSKDKNYLKTKLVNILMAGEDQLTVRTNFLEASMIYYDGDLNKVRHFIMNYDSSLKAEIFEWLKEQTRYETLEVLMSKVAYDLQNLYPDIYQYLDIVEVALEVLALCSKEQSQHVELEKTPALSLTDTNTLTFKFFDDVKAPKIWYEKYKYLRDKDLISYSDGPKAFSGCITRDGIKKIVIARTNTIEEFPILMHEFAHYMDLDDDDSNENLLAILEIPSIYFEELAATYLVTHGYSNTVLGVVRSNRNLSNVESSQILKAIVSLVKRIYENECLSKDDILTAFTIGEFIPENIDERIEAKINQSVDKLNSYLAKQNTLYANCLGYVIGTLVAREASGMSQETVLPVMFDIASNLNSYDLDKVVEALNLRIFRRDESPERKLKK